MSTVTIAPHLQRALEAMSKDMAVDPQALVNQAVFAWLRINGYVTPGTAVQPVVAPVVAPAAVAPAAVAPAASVHVSPVAVAPVAVAPVVAPVLVAPVAAPPAAAPVPVASVAAPVPVAPVAVAPVAAPVVTPPSAPEVAPEESLRATALARMSEISDDLATLAKPWPEWVVAEEEEEEQDEDDAPQEQDEPEQDEQPPAPPEDEDELPPEDPEDEAPARAAPDVDVNTGETEVPLPEPREDEEEEPPAESTVVLRSVPIVLYLEREGEEPVRVSTERFIIGRGPQCDLIIDSPRVSREHLAITRSGIQYFVEDLNSSNGTWLGEERVTTRELESGDVISLGNEPVTFWLRPE